MLCRVHASAQKESEFDEFMKFTKSQGVERKPTEDFIVEQISEKWGSLPEDVRNYEPGGYGSIVDDMGHHIWNQRLPGGYHLSVDIINGPVNLHYDSYDPLNGPVDNFKHYYYEVRKIGNGSLIVNDPVNNNSDWRR